MSLFRISRRFILVSISALTFSAVASANTCTDATFNANLSAIGSGEREFRWDSSYFNESGNEWANKYIYENKLLIEQHDDSKEIGEEIKVNHFYYDVDESALKKKGLEYIISNCSKNDTLCYEQKMYSNGIYIGVEIIKSTPNYASIEAIESSINWFFEYILQTDTLIQKKYYDYATDHVRTGQTLFAADSSDDFKCYQYNDNGEIDYIILYKPNEKGFSLSLDGKEFGIDGEGYDREFFFVKNEETTAIRKTIKPVKISPKARYFDLLGRFKFTK